MSKIIPSHSNINNNGGNIDSRKKTRRIRSNSTFGGTTSPMFGPILEEKLSRTFSLSSSESSNDDDIEQRLAEEFMDEDSCNGGSSIRSIATTNDVNNLVNATPWSLPDLRVPLEIAHHENRVQKNVSLSSGNSNTFVIETMVRRDETKTRFVMYQQSTAEALAQPIFCAEKYPPADGGQILIKSIAANVEGDATDDAPILGSLVKQKKKRTQRKIGTRKKFNSTTTTTYELFLHKPIIATTATPTNNERSSKLPPVVAIIEYEQIGRVRYFVEGGYPRSARVRIFGKGDNDGGYGCAWAESKEPSIRSSDGQKVLDFGGRGRETSSKNAQLVRSYPSSVEEDNGGFRGAGSCCLQMVKWKDHEFNLDFGPPFDAFHAFAFALAQFDF